ncbi:site-specific integrase [Flaviaesturariibacter aridisoli]|uniref:Site-specific integrase n=1 Tax=Flaviaesturariibacter aridisoli TaxID=2545761 RepID=A0A4V2WMI0_9BACT|nr:site-specific integrase [Flaviaesturariibacter aridisoli]TCZ69622.1 hypothetical protein E0486_11900 [Flaviaesturariibacter aridisoli]
MAKNNLTILFWLYKAKSNKQGEAPLYLRISYDNKRKNISTGFAITPERWDALRGQVKGSKEDARLINTYITESRGKLMELFNSMHRERNIDLDVLVERFFGRDANQMTLMELITYHNKEFESRVGIDFSYSTFEKYDILRRKVETFIAHKYQKKDIKLKDLSHGFMADFEFYLKSNDKNEHNTSTKYLKSLKKILNMAVLNGWIEENPFKNYKSNYKDVERVYLTQKELDKIESKTFKIERLRLVRDMFLFQCYTGLAYSDMAKLKHGNLLPGIDGKTWIFTRRKKTDVRAAIPLLSKAERIIKAYDLGEPNPAKPLFPAYSCKRRRY